MQLGLMYSLKERGLGSSIRAMSFSRVLWFQPGWLAGGPHVVSSSHDVEV